MRYALFLTAAAIVGNQAQAVPSCFSALLSWWSPYHFAVRVLHHTPEETWNISRLGRYAAAVGSNVRADPHHPPELNLPRLTEAIRVRFAASGVTPESLLRDSAQTDQRYAPLVENLFSRARAEGLNVSWTSGLSERASERDITLSTSAFARDHAELRLLVTLAHELRHQYLTATQLPGETRDAFFARWREEFMNDELAAINAGIDTALALERATGVRAESLVTGASQPALALRRHPFRSATRQAEAERQTLRMWNDGSYPRGWDAYLTARWNQLQATDGIP